MPWRPERDYSLAKWIWRCPEEGCAHREYGLADHPFADGVCPSKQHRRRALVREMSDGQDH